MKKKFFGFLITKIFFFQFILSLYIIVILIISNRKNFFKKKINALVLSKDRFDKSNHIFEKLNHYNMYYLPVKIQSLLLVKWQLQLDNLNKKNKFNNKAKINFLNKNSTNVKKIREEYLYLINKIFPRVFRFLKIKILFSGSVHYIQDHDIATVAKSNNIPFVIFHRENVFFTREQIEFQIKQYENYVESNADIIFVNNEVTRNIIKKTIGNKTKVLITKSYLNLNKKKGSAVKKCITLFSFTDNYGLGALNFFKNSKRWYKLFYNVHLIFFKLVDKYPNEKFVIKTKWSGKWIKSIEDIWYKNFKKKFPKNLVFLNENHSSIDIIKNSKFIISFNSTAILEGGLMNKEVIIPNFHECKINELRKFSFGNEKEAKNHFKVADSEREFYELIEKEIIKKKSFCKLKVEKKLLIHNILNPNSNLIEIISIIDMRLKNLIDHYLYARKVVTNDLCFFLRPKFYHLENIVPLIYYLKSNFKIKNKIKIILSRIEDYEYLKYNRSVFNSISNISDINYFNSKKSVLNRFKNLMIYLKIFSKKRTFYVYKPGRLLQLYLNINRIFFKGKINYYILNYDKNAISKPTLEILRSIKTPDVNIANTIVSNISSNFFDKNFYKKNNHKILKLEISRFSDFWIKKILLEESKLNTFIPKRSIFFPLAVLDRNLYNKTYDFKLTIKKILFLLDKKYKKCTIIFRPHPTTNIRDLKIFLKKIKFKNYKILYNHYFYLISKCDFSVRYMASTIDSSHAILKKKLFRFYPNELINKDRMIHNVDQKQGYDKFIFNLNLKINEKEILKKLIK